VAIDKNHRRYRWQVLKESLAERRESLIRKLGGRCQRCGSTTKLEFHHTKPRTWTAAAVSRSVRIRLYEADYEKGIIELLCKKCNKAAGEPKEDVPDDFVPDF
jgi:5-methylcytosine-specific restriction endonuclease McrA